MNLFDGLISYFAPVKGLQRAHARKLLRSYAGAESHRLNANKKPKNRSANEELAGPFGADAMRAWARQLVRDNAWAWSALDSIVSETIGTGIGVQSMLEDESGQDVEDTNENRDKTWREWCEVCDVNGQLTFNEIQVLAYREMVEAGECLIHIVNVPKSYRGIYRPVPLALELIEADRLAGEYDTPRFNLLENGNRIVRGVELDELGRAVAYWVYPAHPTDPGNVLRQQPVRLEARNVLHLFRRDRIGQTRGISWFAPVVGWLRDLGVYVENEMQASAVASCFTVAIKTNNPAGSLLPPTTDDETTDTAGNTYEYLQPGMIMRLNRDESIESANPGRPNASSGPWIDLMLRGIAAGTGTSFEAVSKNFSMTTYSSSRTAKLENRPRFRRGQQYWMAHLCQPVWDRFCDAAALAGRAEFPTQAELLADRRKFAPVEFMPPLWEWVDLTAEQQSSESAINAFQSSYAVELGGKGLNWRRVFYQRAKEEQLKKSLGLVSPADGETQANLASAEPEQTEPQEPTGEMAGLSTLQWNRNRKAIEKVLNELAGGQISEAKARVFLESIGMRPKNIDALIADAMDGTVDSLPQGSDVEETTADT